MRHCECCFRNLLLLTELQYCLGKADVVTTASPPIWVEGYRLCGIEVSTVARRGATAQEGATCATQATA